MSDAVERLASDLEDKILASGAINEDLIMEVFRFQADNCIVYKDFLKYLGVDSMGVKSPESIPFLPISAFKYHRVGWSLHISATLFMSSGTTGSDRSKHYVIRPDLYNTGIISGFEAVWGKVNDWVILALLPSYLEQGNSSLVWMVNHLFEFAAEGSGFFKNDFVRLDEALGRAVQSGKKVMLWGVAYALADYADFRNKPLPEGVVVLETGGMKGRRKELPKDGLHELLSAGLGVKAISSEYGMTELLSQAWSVKGNCFQSGPLMEVAIAHNQNPLEKVDWGKRGRILVCDLLNVHSCSFVATDDLGQLNEDGSFMVFGRLDNAEIRGCNLLYEL